MRSVLDPGGPQAASIYGLWQFMIVTAAVVYVIVRRP